MWVLALQLVFGVTNWISALIADILGQPDILVFIVIGALALLAVEGVYIVVAAPGKAQARVAKLVEQLDITTHMLSEAEHIGRFGSFAWNFEDASASSWSQEMYELFGLVPRQKAPQVSVMIEQAHEKDREEVRNALERAQSQPGDFSFAFRAIAPSGQMRYLRIQGTTTLTPEKKLRLMQGVAHDVTAEMEIDRAKTEFVSLASHQLKTPLTAIKWLAETLLQQEPKTLTPDQIGYVSKIQEESRLMMSMINDLLNISRIELGRLAIHLEELDVCEVASTVITEQQHSIDEKALHFNFMCDTELPHMIADRNLVRTVFQNLISNAIKYTPKGGTVECEITPGGAKRETIFIRVMDTGIGIPKAERDRVFEKLHRASNAQALVPDGTGLGLYVIKIIANQVAGDITFESTEGKGTTFYVSLPLRWQGTGSKSLTSQ
jgi:signal transduction histidine kinase